MSLTAFCGFDAGAADGASVAEEPKISANKSCVFWFEPRLSSALVGVEVPFADGNSSPIRSTSESLSTRVEPTLRFSETVMRRLSAHNK